MSEPENFLSRWSRRKHDAQSGEAPKPEAPVEQAVAEPACETSATPEAATTANVPEIDLSALPSIDSITAATDIRAFLTPGIPAELTRAALRRAWVADPQIRDFVGIAENQWDFNAPDGIPGFGSIGAADVRRLAKRILGDEPSEPARRTAQNGAEERGDEPCPDERSQLPGCTPSSSSEGVAPLMEDNVDREKNVTPVAAAQNEAEDDSPAPSTPTRRQHGGALPQ